MLKAQREDRKRLQRSESTTYEVVAAADHSYEISGTVHDRETGEPLISAPVQVKGLMVGTLTDADGRFTLRFATGDSATIQIEYVGYLRLEQAVYPGASELKAALAPQVFMTDEVVVSAARLEEKTMNSVVSVYKINAMDIRQSPNLNLYSMPYSTPGVEVVSSSIGFQVMNARGFNSTSNARFLYWVDGVDVTAPGLNIVVGMLNGVNDLDVASAEITTGPASALYGPNAFNGMFQVYTKSPFDFPGLSVSAKAGVTHADNIDHYPSPMYDVGVRYAHRFSNRWAFKVNSSILSAYDWEANSRRDVQVYEGVGNNIPGPGNPGYDGANRYGEVVNNVFTPSRSSTPFLLPGAQVAPLTQSLLLARTGYAEPDLLDYNMRNVRTDASVHFRPTDKLELIAFGRYALGTAIYQATSRFNLQDFATYQAKLELRGRNFFVRTYTSGQYSANSYNSELAAVFIEGNRKANENWFAQYLLAYTGDQFLNGALQATGQPTLAPGNDAAARAFADGDNRALQPVLQQILFSQLQPTLGTTAAQQQAAVLSALYSGGQARVEPGSAEYQGLLQQAKRQRIDGNLNTGAKYFDRSRFYHAEAQYNFEQLKEYVELIVGGNYRLYTPNSGGTIFADTNGVSLTTYEYGTYVQASRWLLNERLRLLGSLRFDGHKYFQSQLSPRLAALYALGERKNHIVRATWQTGFRQSSLQDQFSFLDLGRAIDVGAIKATLDRLNLETGNNFSQSSYQSYLAARQQGQTPEQAAQLLQRIDIQVLKPEQVINYELGYRNQLNDRLSVDVVGYYSEYRRLIANATFLTATLSDLDTPNETLTIDDIENRNFEVYRIAYNNTRSIPVWGYTLAAGYRLNRQLTLDANLTHNDLKGEDEAYINQNFSNGFNSSRYRANIGLSGRKIRDRWGFNAIWHWVDAFYYQAAIGRGVVPAYQTVDLQVSYSLPEWYSTIKLGGTNILNNRHIEVISAPLIGSLYYVQWILDLNLQFGSDK
ncbi:MAG: TonB-dependent receptor [Bacteroidetes bacterium]|nr:TonB-dependent receptor [Bacteroidota bacterium]